MDVTQRIEFAYPPVGYANKSALHPLGSYIGFEPGPTVFAQPLVYQSDLMQLAQDYEDVLEDHRSLVRELDQIINGDHASEQASLCDLVSQLRLITSRK